MCAVQVPVHVLPLWVCDLLTPARPPGSRQTANKILGYGTLVKFPSSFLGDEGFDEGECKVSIFNLMRSGQSEFEGRQFGSRLDQAER